MNARRGMSLIEIVVTLGMGAIMLGLAAGLVHTLIGADRASHAALVESAALASLAHDFRRDVRGATTADGAETGDDRANRVVLGLADDRRVEYRIAPAGVLRVESRPGEPGRRELYRLVRARPQRFAVERTPGGQIVVLATAPAAGGPVPNPSRGLRIEAVLGADRRFEFGRNP